MNRCSTPCSSSSEPGETWIDIGAGAGRYALPIALALAPSGGRVIALDASPGMLDALLELQAEHGVTDVEVVETRWPPPRPHAARSISLPTSP